MTEEFKELSEQREQLIKYISSKIKAEDWHAVADAAMDLREIDAVLKHIFISSQGEEEKK